MIRGIAETVLYAEDITNTAQFYVEVLGLEMVRAPDDMFAAIRLTPESVLLLFDHRQSSRTGRDVPSHGATGPGHVAFLVRDLDAWRDRLKEAGVTVEKEIEWNGGGRSIYLRDPANNSVELIDRDIWPAGAMRN